MQSEYNMQFEAFGKDTLIMRSIPSWLQAINEKEFLNDLLDAFKNDETKHFASMQRQKVARIASSHILKKNVSYSMEEMEELIMQLSKCENPYVGMDNKPIWIALREEDLAKEFR